MREQVRERLVAQRATELAREEGEKRLQAWKGGAADTGLAAPVVVSRENPQGLVQPVITAALSTDPQGPAGLDWREPG